MSLNSTFLFLLSLYIHAHIPEHCQKNKELDYPDQQHSYLHHIAIRQKYTNPRSIPPSGISS